MFKEMFAGRLKRKEFFWKWLGVFLVMVVLNVLSVEDLGVAMLLVVICLSILCTIYCFSLTARRLRDAGANPWLCLLGLIPVVSFFLGLYCLFKGSAPEAPGTPYAAPSPRESAPESFSGAASPASVAPCDPTSTSTSAAPSENESVADFFNKKRPDPTATSFATPASAPEVTITESSGTSSDATLAKEQIDRLKALSELRKDGSISQAEFEHLKKRILEG